MKSLYLFSLLILLIGCSRSSETSLVSSNQATESTDSPTNSSIYDQILSYEYSPDLRKIDVELYNSRISYLSVGDYLYFKLNLAKVLYGENWDKYFHTLQYFRIPTNDTSNFAKITIDHLDEQFEHFNMSDDIFYLSKFDNTIRLVHEKDGNIIFEKDFHFNYDIESGDLVFSNLDIYDSNIANYLNLVNFDLLSKLRCFSQSEEKQFPHFGINNSDNTSFIGINVVFSQDDDYINSISQQYLDIAQTKYNLDLYSSYFIYSVVREKITTRMNK